MRTIKKQWAALIGVLGLMLALSPLFASQQACDLAQLLGGPDRAVAGTKRWKGLVLKAERLGARVPKTGIYPEIEAAVATAPEGILALRSIGDASRSLNLKTGVIDGTLHVGVSTIRLKGLDWGDRPRNEDGGIISDQSFAHVIGALLVGIKAKLLAHPEIKRLELTAINVKNAGLVSLFFEMGFRVTSDPVWSYRNLTLTIELPREENVHVSPPPEEVPVRRIIIP